MQDVMSSVMYLLDCLSNYITLDIASRMDIIQKTSLHLPVTRCTSIILVFNGKVAVLRHGGCKFHIPLVFFLRQFPLVSQPCTGIVSVSVPALLSFELGGHQMFCMTGYHLVPHNALVILIPLSVLYRLGRGIPALDTC